MGGGPLGAKLPNRVHVVSGARVESFSGKRAVGSLGRRHDRRVGIVLIRTL